MHSQTTLAYAAGILDGEGHFSIIFHRPHNRHHAIVGVMNTNKDLMEWLKSTFGGAIYHRVGPYNKPHWKDRYEWRLHQRAQEAVLPSVLPFLIIKREQAKLIIEFRRTFSLQPRQEPLHTATFEIRESLRQRLLVLNDRRHFRSVNLGSRLSVLDFP